METFLVKSSLFHKEVDIELALSAAASQETCGNEEHDLMQSAANCIKELKIREAELKETNKRYIELLTILKYYGEWSQIYKQASAQVQEILDAQEIKN